ncbi:hypothetical protein FIBSPDRAFT_903223 [Athelia psychrophila]|uniref:Uncharacterized protein n=1 Tax=Athelia psychrophila TaxID=1759441 RepID=A0A167W9U1_9AGAM|nr:hypothetical protein FIBSPDRAFT_903223 [Fibularhizoctonia sp. CBS 109695]
MHLRMEIRDAWRLEVWAMKQEWSVYHLRWSIVNQASRNGETGAFTMKPASFSPVIRWDGVCLDRQRDMEALVPSRDSLPNILVLRGMSGERKAKEQPEPVLPIINGEDSSGSGVSEETIENHLSSICSIQPSKPFFNRRYLLRHNTYWSDIATTILFITKYRGSCTRCVKLEVTVIRRG